MTKLLTLTILALTTCIATESPVRADLISFQNGVGTATATDTFLNQDNGGGQNNGSSPQLRMDAGGLLDHGLLRFENVFGNGPGQIPIGSTINSASLALTTGGSATADGNGGAIHRMLGTFTSSDTWNDWGDGSAPHNSQGGIQADGLEAVATADLVLPFQDFGRRSYDVTTSVAAWAAGADNFGWVLFGTFDSGANRWEVFSGDHATVADRPELTIDFDAPTAVPVPEPSTFAILGLGLIGMAGYGWRRKRTNT